jgi:amino acid transporter
MSANALLFISCAGQIAFIPVIAEMRDPRDFRKALYVCMGFVGSVYVAFSLIGNIFSALITFLETSSLTRM